MTKKTKYPRLSQNAQMTPNYHWVATSGYTRVERPSVTRSKMKIYKFRSTNYFVSPNFRYKIMGSCSEMSAN